MVVDDGGGEKQQPQVLARFRLLEANWVAEGVIQNVILRDGWGWLKVALGSQIE